MHAFIGREKELETLQAAYASPRAELVVVYGRRRIGKTYLLSHFFKDKPCFYFSAKKQSDDAQLRDFSDLLQRSGSRTATEYQLLPNWERAFEALVDLPSQGKKIVILDKFPAMVKENPSILSVLQHLWDHQVQNLNILLILCGSSIAFIEQEILSVKSPLFARATRTLKLQSMSFDDASKFFPIYSAEEKVIAYSILGGSPYTLQSFDAKKSLETNIINEVLSPSGLLWDYPIRLLHEKFRDQTRCNDIMRAITEENYRFSEISKKTQIQSVVLPRYLRARAIADLRAS